MYLLSPLIVQNFKKILRADPKLLGHAIFKPRPLAPRDYFFEKPISKSCHAHSCLSTYKKSESDVGPLMRY